jgi:hypothetical protein
MASDLFGTRMMMLAEFIRVAQSPLKLNTSWLGHVVVLPFIKPDKEELQVVFSSLRDFYGKDNGLIMNLEKMKLFWFMFRKNDMISDRNV